jgi:hypothetical protein
VPEDPPQWSLDLIGHVSLIGGILELVAGVTVLIVERIRSA